MSDKKQNTSKPNSGGYADEIIEGHSYDGIMEYDNPMPLWWKAVFVVTIIWSPIYIGLLEAGYINTYEQSLHEEDVYWTGVKEEYRKSQPDLTPERIKTEFNNKDRIAAGKATFETNCAACHGANAGGNIGPNLTDKYWLHGGAEDQIFHVIDGGVLEKGMPAWGAVLTPDDILNVGAFVISLRNTNVEGGKAPQGEPYVADGDSADAAGDAGGDAAGDAAAEEAAPEGEAGQDAAAEGAESEGAESEGADSDAAEAPEAPDAPDAAPADGDAPSEGETAAG